MKHRPANVVELSNRLHGEPDDSRRQALEQLFDEHGASLRIFLLARIGFQDDIEDIVQELFLDLIKMDDLFTRIAPESGSNRAFLCACANNLMLRRERRRALERRYSDEQRKYAENQSDQSEHSPEDLVATSQELDAVVDGIKRLNPNWRRAFVLNRFHFMSYPKIAAEMGVSVKQIEKYISSALKKLRVVSEHFHQRERAGQEDQYDS